MRYLEETNREEYNIFKGSQMSHLHLTAPITGIPITENWAELDLSNANLNKVMLGYWSYDSNTNSIVWDKDNVIKTELKVPFIGDANIELSAQSTADLTVFLGLFIDGVLTIETPVTFEKKSIIKSYGANGSLENETASLIQPMSSYKFKIRCSAGETATAILNSFLIMVGKQ